MNDVPARQDLLGRLRALFSRPMAARIEENDARCRRAYSEMEDRTESFRVIRKSMMNGHCAQEDE